MKNLKNILRRSNLTPLERVTTLVHHGFHQDKTGKRILSDAELHAITRGWKADPDEVREYNRYLKIVHFENTLRMDTHMFAFQAELSLVKNQRMISYFLSDLKITEGVRLQEMTTEVSKEEAMRFAANYTYLDYRRMLHTFTFHNLSYDIQKDLYLLDDSVAESSEYLEDEVLLYEVFNNGTSTKKDKDMLVDTIFSRMYVDGMRKLRRGTEKDGFLLSGYFAELPLREVINKVACEANIPYKDREDEELLADIEEYITGKGTTIQQIVKETLHTWLAKGLFTKEFIPIFASEDFKTWNGNTKESHKELFRIWYKELKKSEGYFQELFNAGKLEKRSKEMVFLGEKRVVEILTGESLYTCSEDADFVSEYKQQVEALLPFTNLVYLIDKHKNPQSAYTTLCELRKLAKDVSDIFDINLTEEYDQVIDRYKDEASLLNHELRKLTDAATEYLYTHSKQQIRYEIHIVDGTFNFDLEEKGKTAEIVKRYVDEFKTAMPS